MIRTPIDVATAAADSVLPYDGPHDDEELMAASATVYELVRRLNNATRRRTSVAAIDRIVGDFAHALRGMPQLFEQISVDLDRLAYEPKLRSDGRAPGSTAQSLALGAASDLRMVEELVGDAGSLTDRAFNSLSHLYEEADDE